jgi:hypothetical protein
MTGTGVGLGTGVDCLLVIYQEPYMSYLPRVRQPPQRVKVIPDRNSLECPKRATVGRDVRPRVGLGSVA